MSTPSMQDKIEHEFLGLDPAKTKIVNPFENRTVNEIANSHLHVLRVMRDPNYFYFTCKALFNGPSGRPLEILPFQCVILKELWYRPFPMIIGARGASKSFLMGLYSLLRALFIQGRKIVITGSGFRQAKTVFNYAETIWHNSPILQSLVAENSQSGPHHDADRWWLRVGDSMITCIPLGDGSRIRGERANDVICDEFACMSEFTLIDTPDGLRRMGDTIGEPDFCVHDGYGDVRPVSKFVRTPPTAAYRVRTVGGYEFICSGIHRVGTADGWKLAKDLVKSDLIEFPTPPPFPERYIDGVDCNTGWLLGILVAEGSVSDLSQVSVSMTDRDCVERVQTSMIEFDSDIKPGIYHRDGYEDERGWTAKETWCCFISRRHFRDRLASLGLHRTTAHGKTIPWSILQSPRTVVISFLSAIFEGDGSAFLYTDRDIDNKFGVAYYSVSEQLCREVQVVLRKIGYFSTRHRRRSKLSKKWQWMLRLNGGHALRLADELSIPKWQHILDDAERSRTRDDDNGVSWDKSRSQWRAFTKVRGRSKYLGRFATKWEADEAVATIVATESTYLRVSSVERLDGQHVLFDYSVPPSHSFLGNGIRQHNSTPWEIYETVVRGFGVVELEPVQKVKRRAEIRVYKREGLWSETMQEDERKRTIGNQSIISGTAFYSFNHFADYWRRWKSIIESKGDRRKLDLIFPNGVSDKFDWRDYSIIRLPVELLPEGFMDEKQVENSRATQHSAIFANEFSAIFSSDSNGFFKRSLVESCVTTDPIIVGGESVTFRAVTKGNPSAHYIYGVDPASEHDRFSIVILEVYPTHRRIVYCWTTTRQQHRARVQAGATMIQDFYGYCARKIRELMKLFPCEHIAVDSQGGGVAISEALHDPDKMERGEKPMWPIGPDHPLSDGKERDSDNYVGLHILEMVNFASGDYVMSANHGLRKDFEDKVLLFPHYDTVILAVAMEDDFTSKRTFDTLEDAVAEVEEIKEELATIVHTQTQGSFRDRWDTPEVKLAGSRKGRQRKDRYSALLMANSSARRLNRQVDEPDIYPMGGFVHSAGYIAPVKPNSKMYVSGPDWFLQGVDGVREGYGWVARRSGVNDL